MPVVNPEKLVKLQHAPEEIRNICILAHVDHGKTSLTDALIATNGIISPKLAGKIRYLDSRPDEQLRGITMESSAISLYFSMMRRSAPDADPKQEEYLINLIDSPGHIDFSSEVSTASRLCDGAVVLVDAVEGVCSQTITVLRQAWIEKLRPLLVINKMDRLITELKMSPSEANTHLSKLLQQVNAVMGSFFSGERMEDDLKWRERMEERLAAQAAKSEEKEDGFTNATGSTEVSENGDVQRDYLEKDDEDIYFEPEKNNVIFCSAIDGWAFTVKQFAVLYEKKLGIKRTTLEKVLWGDFYFDPKTKRVLGSKHLKGRNLKPMFVQLVLENVWAVYAATTGGDHGKGDSTMVEKITKSLSINLPNHILRSRDPRALLMAVFAQWLPVSVALLVSVIEHLPSPLAAQKARIPDLLDGSPAPDKIDKRLRLAMSESHTGKDEPVVAYVSKMVSVKQSELPENKPRGGAALTADEARELARKKRAEIARAQAAAGTEGANVSGVTDALGASSINDDDEDEQPAEVEEADPEHLIGFARLYSGTLTVGDEIYVLPPKFSPARPYAKPVPQKVTITGLYLMMGRGLEALTHVPAGCVFGVAGLAGHVLKSGTLCSQLEGGVNLAGVSMGTQPIVRVALEPENPSDLEKMIKGLRMLEQSDPCAEYEQLESGEHVILTAGELHLERCLKDLRERFARCEIQAGEPIVPYRETIVKAEEMNPPKDKDLPRGTVVGVTSSKQITVRLRVRPLPDAVTDFLNRNTASIKRLQADISAERDGERTADTPDDAPHEPATSEHDGLEDAGVIETGVVLSLVEFREQLQAAFEEEKADQEVWKHIVDKITAFGSRRVGPNVLIDATKHELCERLLHETTSDEDGQPTSTTLSPSDFTDKITYAFQLATAQGPLCNEPMQGVALFLEDVTLSESPSREDLGRLTGEVIRTTRSSIHAGFLDWSPRIMLAMYSVEILASTDVLGRVYSLIHRRGGRILSEVLTPLSIDQFTILATLPVAESFGFAEEIRKRTSGAASPQLVFRGFERLGLDPFWVPTTEEELEDLGEYGDKENVAKRYVDRVRRKKGLLVERKIVAHGEKQKTLKR